MEAKQIDVIPVHHITSTVPATDNRLDRKNAATTSDLALNQLSYYIFLRLAASEGATPKTTATLLELS